MAICSRSPTSDVDSFRSRQSCADSERSRHGIADTSERRACAKGCAREPGCRRGIRRSGVRWLDEYINRQRDAAAPNVKERLPSTLGTFRGECVRQSFGGEWLQDPEVGWAVRINEKLTVYPFNKVRKQLSNAEGDSVLSFFSTIPALMQGKPTRPCQPREDASKRPWWKVW